MSRSTTCRRLRRALARPASRGQCRPDHRHHRLPGLDYCALANARSIPSRSEVRALRRQERQREIGELKIKISGCINACGHHHVGHIGILGVEKKGEEFYQITLGGSGDETARSARSSAAASPTDEIVDAVETVVDTYDRGADRVAEHARGDAADDAPSRQTGSLW
jgi:sulfite reductase beta subunit-like hemoprotein